MRTPSDQPLGLLAVPAADSSAHLVLDADPLWVHAVRGLISAGACGEVAVVVDIDNAADPVHARLAVSGLRASVSSAAALASSGVETRPLIIGDPWCPLVTAADIATVASGGGDRPRVGVLPVVDSVKVASADGAMVRGTVDRATLRQIAAPLALPATEAGALSARFGPRWVLGSLPDLVGELPAGVVELVDVGPLGGRVVDADDVRVLAARRRALNAAIER
jgi:hypothetical protein